MIKLYKTLGELTVALVAFGIAGGFVVPSTALNARQAQSKEPADVPDRWIGKKIVTK